MQWQHHIEVTVTLWLVKPFYTYIRVVITTGNLVFIFFYRYFKIHLALIIQTDAWCQSDSVIQMTPVNASLIMHIKGSIFTNPAVQHRLQSSAPAQWVGAVPNTFLVFSWPGQACLLHLDTGWDQREYIVIYIIHYSRVLEAVTIMRVRSGWVLEGDTLRSVWSSPGVLNSSTPTINQP